MTISLFYWALRRLLEFVMLLVRSDAANQVEILVLRHELMVLRRQIERPRCRPADRAVLAGLGGLLPRERWGSLFVRPETIRRWHRALVARRWTYAHRPPGRPSVAAGVHTLVRRLARENPSWGYRRIHGEMTRLGIKVAPSTVWEILDRAGIEPTPHRVGETWRGFLRAQAAGIAACDFLTVDTVLLRRLYVLVFVELASRGVYLAGVTANPSWEWVTQQARNVIADLGQVKFLIRDRDAKFSKSFDEVFRSEGIRIIRTPIKAPRANAVCERWIGSLRREYIDRLLIFGRGHLVEVLTEYVDHFNRHRPHRSLGQRAPQDGDQPPRMTPASLTDIRRRDRLGGLLHEYEWAA